MKPQFSSRRAWLQSWSHNFQVESFITVLKPQFSSRRAWLQSGSHNFQADELDYSLEATIFQADEIDYNLEATISKQINLTALCERWVVDQSIVSPTPALRKCLHIATRKPDETSKERAEWKTKLW